jgi:DNA repair protein RadC
MHADSTQTKLTTFKPHYAGHRDRLRKRRLKNGGEALQDYELLELLLLTAIPRRDVKPLAKTLLTEFKDLWGLLNTAPKRLLKFGLSETIAASLLATGAVALRTHKSGIMKTPLLKASSEL